MNKPLIKKILLVCVSISIVLTIVFFLLLEKQMNQALPIVKNQLFTVKSGSSVASFSKELVKKGWIDNRFWLRAYARLQPDKAIVKVGTYLILANSSLHSVLALVTSGKEHQFRLTIVEGTTFKQLLTQLQNQPQLTHSLYSLSVEQISAQLEIEQVNPEGWFFPETYSFTQGEKDFNIIKRAHVTMQTVLSKLWQERAVGLPYETPYQALIMASIIEKETSYIPEQPLISSVFINRLAKKMRLQTDPTVIYGLGERYQGDITRAHLREKTVYNTYRINGLPPTPIAMPGLSAIKAALNPAISGYYYFVSQGGGKHTFSKTLVEHNIAVRDFLTKQKNKQ
jgi:UPF0755 protein